MGYYPVFWEMEGRPVLLVGGGHVADEKIHKLVDAGAQVTIVAPELIPEVRRYVDEGRARLWERAVQAGDSRGFEVVMVATDDGAVNRMVADEARSHGIWVNAADDVNNCDFILPSLARRGKIAIASSTGGSSPALARWLRERMEEFLSDEVVALGDLPGRGARRGARAGPRVRRRLRTDRPAAAPPLQDVPEPHPRRRLAGGDRRRAPRAAPGRSGRAGTGAPRGGARHRSTAPPAAGRERSPGMLTLATMSHHTAPIAVREQLSIAADNVPDMIRRARAEIGQMAIIATCNRLELYLPGEHDPERLLSFIGDVTGAPEVTLRRSFHVHHDTEVVRHLYRVAAGLESMVMRGEAEILGQVRTAFATATDAGTDDARLVRLFPWGDPGRPPRPPRDRDRAPRALRLIDRGRAGA